MKFSRSRVAFFAALGLSTPFLVLAAVQQFKGPVQTPPLGNVPGVIWNTAGSNQPQAGAEINISGKATIGSDLHVSGASSASGSVTVGSDLTASTLTGGQDKMNQILGDNKLQPGKAFRIDQQGATTYFTGNWGGVGGSSQPLTMTFFGDVKADRIDPFVGAGNEGRVQARKFCFFPGNNPGDCIAAWPQGGNGLSVQKTGDLMTGTLNITVPPTTTGMNITGGSGGGYFEGGLWGVEARSDGNAVYAHSLTPGVGVAVVGMNGQQGGQFTGSKVGVQGEATDLNLGFGGQFKGGKYAVVAQSSTPGVGTAVYGYNGAVGGEFTGTAWGVRASGPFGSSFSSNAQNLVVVGSSLPAPAISVPVGNIQAPGNTLEACAWTAAVADGLQLLCPVASPILNGIKKGVGTTQAYCCKL